MVLPVVPILAAAGLSAAGGIAAGWSMNDDSGSKKAANVSGSSSSGGSSSSIFPEVKGAPFSFTSPSYTYSPSDNSVQHAAYEQYQPTYTDSRQFDITYPNYTYIIDSPDAVVSNKKESQLDNRTSVAPSMQETYTPSTNSGNSSGIDPIVLIGGAALVLIALGGIAIVTK